MSARVIITVLAIAIGIASIWLIPQPAKVHGEFEPLAMQAVSIAGLAWLAMSLSYRAVRLRRRD